MNTKETKKYFPFYYNWADMINESYDDDDDKEYAKLLAFAIVRYASTGEIIDLGDKRAQRMFERCLTYGVDSADENYTNGAKGGRPRKLTEAEFRIIAVGKTMGKTAKSFAEEFCVSDDTIRRCDGWRNPQKYTQNVCKTQNQEKEEKEEEKEEYPSLMDGVNREELLNAKTDEDKLRIMGF